MKTTVLGPGLPLETKEDSSVLVHVGPRTFRPWQGQISFEASGEESRVDGQFALRFSLMTRGTSTVRQNMATPEFLDEVSASGSVDHVEVSTFTPLPGPPDQCVYRTVTISTTAGAGIAADRPTPAAQLSINETSGAYVLFFQPARLEATTRTEATASLASGPATCDPGGTTTTEQPAAFLPEDLIGVGTFDPGATAISGSAELMTGLDPLATYRMTWTLTRN